MTPAWRGPRFRPHIQKKRSCRSHDRVASLAFDRTSSSGALGGDTRFDDHLPSSTPTGTSAGPSGSSACPSGLSHDRLLRSCMETTPVISYPSYAASASPPSTTACSVPPTVSSWPRSPGSAVWCGGSSFNGHAATRTTCEPRRGLEPSSLSCAERKRCAGLARALHVRLSAPVDDAVLGAPFLDALGWRWQRPRSTKFSLVLENSSAALQLDKKFSGVIISIMHQVASFGARVLLAGRCPLLRRTLVS